MNWLKVFKKDIKIAGRDMLLIYIIIIPVLIAVAIRLLAPGISDHEVRLAMLKGEDPEMLEYVQELASVELFDNEQQIHDRVLKRDDVVAIVYNGSHYDIISEGNEDPGYIDNAAHLAALYELGSVKEESTATIYSLQQRVPRVKTMMTNILIEVIIMLAGMIIALGIIDEKNSNTISAVRVSPVSLTQFIVGKCTLGCLFSLISIVLCLLILGYTHINWLMLMLSCLCTMIIAGAFGLLQGVISSDIIEAAAGVKMMMLPILAAILIYQLVSEKWQWTMYWNPFYWSYKANNMILSGTANWGEVLLWSGLVLVITLLVLRSMKPKIEQGLHKS